MSETMTIVQALNEAPAPALRSNSGWTDERIELLKRLWASGLSASQVANALGDITRNAVIGKVNRLGLSQRNKPQTPRAPRRYRPRASVPRDEMRAENMINDLPCEEIVEVVDIDIPAEQRKTLLELEPGMCRWVVGDPCSTDFFFCAGESVKNLSYCAYHCRVAYAPSRVRERRRRTPHPHQPGQPQQEAA